MTFRDEKRKRKRKERRKRTRGGDKFIDIFSVNKHSELTS